MITGTVTAAREAVIRLTIRDPAGLEHEVEAVIDTGYNGTLLLPPALVSTMGLPFRRRGRALLADGSETVFDIHEATVLWDGKTRRAPVDVADTDPLVGMALLYGHELTIEVVEDGEVSVRALLQS